ncbi:MAG: tRNA 4-thiouridine(8) synthase ThiI [Treponema sp.]|nr:tRNA 4-thiouridine(8) synthase ThiI [Treponema sp.]
MKIITYLAKLGELTLKGSNLKEFEMRLIENARLSLETVEAKISLRAGRMYIDCPESSCDAVEWTLNHLIGITGWAKTIVCEKSIESIKEVVMKLAIDEKEKGAKSFKIETKRADKSFPLNAYEVCCKAAEDVFEKKILTVDVKKPDTIIWIEIRERCFIYSYASVGHRGLPVGTSSRGLLLLSGGIDSPVAGYRMMRRGMKIDCCYFHAYPYTSDEAQKKVEELAKIIAMYGVKTNINIIPFTEVQMKIKQTCANVKSASGFPANSYTTLLLRMCMMKCASILAKHIKCKCLVTGESLGQVASQTIENMNVTESACDLPLLRPCVGLDKEEIVDTAKFIGTYETSILPYEDCCVLFSPKHPILRATHEDAWDLYNSMNIDNLIQEAFEKREVKTFSTRNYVAENFSKTN